MTRELVGIGLVFFGLLLRAWSMLHLSRAGIFGDRFYGCAIPPNGYTAHGPYRLLEHPAYAGSMMVFMGIGVLALGWGGLVLAVPAWPFFVDRAKAEGRLRASHEVRRASEHLHQGRS